MRRVAVALAAAVLLAAGARASEEHVRLEFAWPQSLLGKIDVLRQVTGSREGAKEQSELRSSFRLQAEPHPEGRLVRFRAPSFSEANGPSQAPLNPKDALRLRLARIGELPPDLIVGPDGRFLRLDGLEELRTRFSALIDDATKDQPLDAAHKKAYVDALAQAPRLEAVVLELWSAIVGSWAANEFVVGQIYARQGPALLSLYGGVPAGAVYETAVRRKLACPSKRRTDQECVELAVKSYLDSAEKEQLLGNLRRRLAPGGKEPALTDVAQETELVVVTEPATLLPHRLHSLRRTTQTMGGQRMEAVDEREYTFTYQNWK